MSSVAVFSVIAQHMIQPAQCYAQQDVVRTKTMWENRALDLREAEGKIRPPSRRGIANPTGWAHGTVTEDGGLRIIIVVE
ncbi:hypothetical protein ACMFMF_008365 [Clarireedia jacksonii]